MLCTWMLCKIELIDLLNGMNIVHSKYVKSEKCFHLLGEWYTMIIAIFEVEPFRQIVRPSSLLVAVDAIEISQTRIVIAFFFSLLVYICYCLPRKNESRAGIVYEKRLKFACGII